MSIGEAAAIVGIFLTIMAILSRLTTARIGGVGRTAQKGVDEAALANTAIAALIERVKDLEETARQLERDTREAERRASQAILQASEQKSGFLQLFVLKGDHNTAMDKIDRHLERIETKLDDAIKEKKK